MGYLFINCGRFKKAILKITNKAHFSRKMLAIICIVIFALLLIPIVWVSLYNAPAADDYSFSVFTKKAIDTYGLAGVFSGVYNCIQKFYFSWQGTYMAIALFALPPSLLGEQFYFLSTVILVGLFVIGNYLILKELCLHYLKVDKYTMIIVSVAFIVLSMERVYSSSSAFYWWNGSIFYTGFYSIQLIEFFVCLKYIFTNKKSLAIVLVLLALVIGGANFVTALNNTIIGVLLLIIMFIRKGKNIFTYFLFSFFSIIGLLVSVLAPGNAVRAKYFVNSKLSISKAIAESFQCAGTTIYNNINLLNIISIVFILALLARSYKNIKFDFHFPVLFTLFTFCIYASLFTPTLYAMGSVGPGRTINLYIYEFYWLLLLNGYYWIGWFVKIVDPQNNIHFNLTYRKLGSLVVIFALILGYIIFLNRGSLLSYNAYIDIKSGVAQQYKQESDENFKALHDVNIQNVILKKHSVKPRCIYYDYFDGCVGQSMAIYYHKATVTRKN